MSSRTHRDKRQAAGTSPQDPVIRRLSPAARRREVPALLQLYADDWKQLKAAGRWQ